MEKFKSYKYVRATIKRKSRINIPCLFVLLLNVAVFNSLFAQVVTKSKIYFPLTGYQYGNPLRKLPSGLSEIGSISALIDGTNVSTVDRHGIDEQATSFFNASSLELHRLKIANAEGTNTNTSFFGINTNTGGYDVAKFTISCWIWVDPSQNLKRYLYYGVDGSNKLGFGLSLKGADLYLSKYVNNATADKGAKITNVDVGNTWEGKILGPATFNAGVGWYHVILVQAEYYTRIFVGNPPTTAALGASGKKGKFNTIFAGSMLMHGKQKLSSFTKWGMGIPEGNTTDLPVSRIDDFLVFDYDMTEAEAEALYHCQVANTTETCLGSGQTFTQNFAIIGDYGCDGGSADGISSGVGDVATMVKSWNPNFILTVGDDSYHDSHGNFGCSTAIDNNVGKYYHDYIYPYTGSYGNGSSTGNRFFPVMGNHDDNCSNGPGQCPEIWTNYFPTEQYAPGYSSSSHTAPNNGRYYTFTKGNIQFFAVNSNTEEPDGNTSTSAQATWLKNALANSTATFKVVYMHHAPYSSYNAADSLKRNPNREMLKWPFKEWGADIVVSGDDHYYERNDYRNLTYLVNGVGGMPTLANIAADRIVAGNRVHIQQKFGAIKVQSNNEVMHFQFYSIDPHNRSSNQVADEFYLYKRADGATYLTENPAELAALAVIKKKTEPAFSVYPNPTNGELTVNLSEQTESKAVFKLFDLSGKQVFSQGAVLSKGTQEISLGNLKSKGISVGVYFLQVVSPQRNSTVKVVIQ